MPSEPLFLTARRLAGDAGLQYDEHAPSGFEVPEHFREPEVLGQENHG
jgi:hypothetical protein